MILQLILLFVIGSAVVYLAINLLAALLKNSHFPPFKGAKLTDEALVQCKQCQTFVPKKKAICFKGCYYCCKAHQDQDD